MPIEGIENTANSDAQATSDATANNTGAQQQPAAETQTATNSTEAPAEKTFTQADVDRIVTNRVNSAVKAQLRKLSGEGDKDKSSATGNDDLQRQLTETQNRLRTFEAKASVRDFITDSKNKINAPADAISEIEDLVLARLEYDDDGQPSNLKEVVESLKSRFPRLFAAAQPSSVNAAEGRNSVRGPVNMNEFIRRAAGHGN